jgi:protein TonB
MERSLALAVHAAPIARLDAKRIAATSVAILVHAGVLMLLLMPTDAREDASVAQRDMVVIPTFKPKPIEPIPEKKPDPKPVTLAAPKTPPIAITEPVAPVDDSISPVDVYVPPLPQLPSRTFDAVAVPPVFAQISADVAPTPPYPAQALRRHIQGQVVLRIRVDTRGEPVEVSVETSSGSSLLDEAAVKFVKARWHFVPAMQDGQAVEALARLPIDFSLPR